MIQRGWTPFPCWRHQMETFSTLLALCAGNSPVTGEFPAQRPVTRSFDVFYDLRLNKRLSKQSWGWWYETPSRSFWRHCNALCLRKRPLDPSAHGAATKSITVVFVKATISTKLWHYCFSLSSIIPTMPAMLQMNSKAKLWCSNRINVDIVIIKISS